MKLKNKRSTATPKVLTYGKRYPLSAEQLTAYSDARDAQAAKRMQWLIIGMCAVITGLYGMYFWGYWGVIIGAIERL